MIKVYNWAGEEKVNQAFEHWGVEHNVPYEGTSQQAFEIAQTLFENEGLNVMLFHPSSEDLEAVVCVDTKNFTNR